MFNEEEDNAINGKQKDSVQEETIVVSATMGIKVENRHQHPHLLQSREQKKMAKNLREERVPEVGVYLKCKCAKPS